MKSSGAIGELLTTILAFVAYGAAFAIAFWLKNEAMLNVLAGTAATIVATAVGFWLGSSKGSQNKDEVIRSLAPPGDKP